ncbi:MAG: FMN-binding protein [Limnochordia bacterium]
MVEEQTCENVDTVTGATGTSKGVIEAIANALAQASAQE